MWYSGRSDTTSRGSVLGGFPPAFLALACLSVLATLLALLAIRRSAQGARQRDVDQLLASTRSQAAMWEATAQAIKREVGHELDRLEQKRRAVAAVEGRLRAREDGQAEDQVEAERAAQQQQPDPSTMDRAELRLLRRMGKA